MASNDSVNISFENGLGTLGNAYNVDQSVFGQVTLRGNSALMEWAVGPSAGHGYGTYTINAQANGNTPGSGIIFWPGDNSWPGQEIDLLEIVPNGSGQQYGTVHWNNNGSDAYDAKIFAGVTGNMPHQYQMVWEAGKITMKVDGSVAATFTDHVPKDYDHGGMNNTIGFLNNSNATSLTVFDVSYAPAGASAPAAMAAAPAAVAVVAAPVAAGASATVVDWNALAARVEANFAATGQWSIPGSAAQSTTSGSAGPQAAGSVDWDALGALATANYQATGCWFY